MSLWLQDCRYAFGMLRKNGLLTLVIGANSATFSVVDALLLRPLPYPHPDRLAAIWLHSPAIGILRDLGRLLWFDAGKLQDTSYNNFIFCE